MIAHVSCLWPRSATVLDGLPLRIPVRYHTCSEGFQCFALNNNKKWNNTQKCSEQRLVLCHVLAERYLPS